MFGWQSSSPNTGYTGSTNPTFAKPSGTVAGDLLIAFLYAEDNTAEAWSLSGWTPLFSPIASSDHTLQILWKWAGASEPSSYTFTSTHSYASGCIERYSGDITSGDPFGAVGAGNISESGTTLVIDSITSVGTNDLLVEYVNRYDASASGTPPSGMTERYDYDVNHVADQTIASPSATGTKTYTNSSDTNLIGILFVLSDTAAANTAAAETAAGSFGAGFTAQVAAGAALNADISAGMTQQAVAAAIASIMAGIGLGSADGGIAGFPVDMLAAATLDAAAAALASASSAIAAGLAAGETWAADAATAAQLAADGQFGATFDASVLGVQTGAVLAGTSAGAQFVAAVAALADQVPGVTMAATLAAIAATSASLAPAMAAGVSFSTGLTSTGLESIAIDATFQCAATTLAVLTAQGAFAADIFATAFSAGAVAVGASMRVTFTSTGGNPVSLPPARASLMVGPRDRLLIVAPRRRRTLGN